jgi:epidermal growth factor receptor substrate 15
MSLAPTTLPSSSSLDTKPSGVSQTPGLGSGYGARPLTGPAATPPWPRMSPNDVQRYTRVFSKVDTDHDGKITGEQARQLFLGWQLPRGGFNDLLNGFFELEVSAISMLHARDLFSMYVPTM